MITYENSTEEMELRCDNCDYEASYEGSWQECIETAKMEGWKVYIDTETQQWKHMCPECVEADHA